MLAHRVKLSQDAKQTSYVTVVSCLLKMQNVIAKEPRNVLIIIILLLLRLFVTRKIPSRRPQMR